MRGNDLTVWVFDNSEQDEYSNLPAVPTLMVQISVAEVPLISVTWISKQFFG